MQYLVMLVFLIAGQPVNSDFENLYKTARETTNSGKAIEVANEALKVAQNTEDKAKANFLIAYFESKEDLLDESLKHYYESLTLYKAIKNEEMIGRCYMNIGVLFSKSRNFEGALDIYLMAHKNIRIYDAGSNVEADVIRNIGRQYFNLKQYDSAFVYYAQAQELFKANEHIKRVHDLDIEIGACYKALEEYELARTYYLKGLENGASTKQQARVYNNIGNTFLEQGDRDKALEYYLQANEFYAQVKGLNDKKALCLMNISQCYPKEDGKRLHYMELAGNLKTNDYLHHEILVTLSRLYEIHEQNDKLTTTFASIRDLSDRFNQREQQFDQKFQSIKMEAAVLFIQNKSLAQTSESNKVKYKRAAFGGASLVGLCVLVFIVILAQRKKKIQRAKMVLLTELRRL